VSQLSILSLGRYVVVAIAIVLLAPYAGCHILTTPPDSPTSVEGTENGGNEAISTRSLRAGSDEPSGSSKTEEPEKAGESNLSDIESLLREP